ncbi:MAG: group 1 glycosyl [Geobacteraceae bacterium]|nr:MAG: group 1 glycosyl [Geobacteraceae bacterium]
MIVSLPVKSVMVTSGVTPLKIMFIENGIGYGGAALSLFNHLKALDPNRFKCVVVTPRGGTGYDDYTKVAALHVLPDQTVSRSALRRFFRRVLPLAPVADRCASAADYLVNLLPYVVRLVALLRREHVRVVVLNNDPVCNMGGVIAARLMGLPVASFVRGTLWRSWLTSLLLGKVDRLIAISGFVRGELAALDVDPETVMIVRSIRDWSRFDTCLDAVQVRVEMGLSPGEVAIGITGLLIPWKGQSIFLQAAAKVLADYGNARFIVIGGGVEEYPDYPEQLRELVKSLGIGGKVTFMGQRTDMPRLLAGLDIVVHASTDPEPLGLVIAEGMVMEKPVIATALGGPLELIEEGRTGFLVPPGDPVALATRLTVLVADPELRCRVGKAARIWALENFSRERETMKLVALYEELSATRGAEEHPAGGTRA